MSIFQKRKKLWILVAAIAIVGIFGAAYYSKNRTKLTEVQTGKVNRQDLTSLVTASGQIQPKKKVDISANIPGKIVRLTVEEGDRVQKGDFLLEVDPAPYLSAVANAQAALSGARSDLESARANLKQAEQTYQRKARMWDDKTGLISQDEYERSRTDFEVQKARVGAAQHLVEQSAASLSRAQDDLNKTRVTSPMTGIIVRKAVEEGEVAVIGTMNNPGTVLLTVADLSVMEAELEVDETDIGSITLGQRATVAVDAFPGKEFEGEVTEIGNSPILNQQGGSQDARDFKVTITLKSPDVSLRPGLTADGKIITAKKDDSIAVPIQALVVREDEKAGGKGKKAEKEGVFVVEAGKVHFRPVKTGIMGEMDIEVIEGIKQGEEIVTGSYQTLRDLKDGDPIQIKKEEKGDGKQVKS